MTTFFGNCKASRRLTISTLFFMSFPTDVNRALSVYCSVYMGSGKCIPDVSVNVETSPLPFVELVSKPQVQLSEPMSLQGGCWPRSLASCPPLLPPPSAYLQPRSYCHPCTSSDAQAKADPSDHFEYQFLLPECQGSNE